MPDHSSPDLSRLLSRLAEAEGEAARIGPTASAIGATLAEARRQAEALDAAGRAATEGIRVEDLTTGNDK